MAETDNTTNKMDVCAPCPSLFFMILQVEFTNAKISEEIYSLQTNKSRSSRPSQHTMVSHLDIPVP